MISKQKTIQIQKRPFWWYFLYKAKISCLQGEILKKIKFKSLVRSGSNRTPLDSVGGTKIFHETFYRI